MIPKKDLLGNSRGSKLFTNTSRTQTERKRLLRKGVTSWNESIYSVQQVVTDNYIFTTGACGWCSSPSRSQNFEW